MRDKPKVITCGCRFNRYESAEIKERIGADIDKPVVVINSCAVTAKSEAKSRHAVRRAIRENPDASIVVSGCWAELDPRAVGEIEGVDLVLGNEEKFSTGSFLSKKNSAKTYTGGVNSADGFLETAVGFMESRTAAYLKIQNGCDETCSFCVVRLARGKSRSASPEFVKERTEKLIKDGAKEIVLTGINVGQYGNDLSGDIDLANVLNLVAENKKARFRLSSINPNEVTKELLEVMAENKNICRYLHIPLQAGSDRVLKMMRRPYSASDYRKKIELASYHLPNLALGCDIIAGFPGESDEEFNNSLQMFEELPFTYAHVFAYSAREQADSSKMGGQVSSAVKKERAKLLKLMATAKNLKFRESLIGSDVVVLVEAGEDDSGVLRGKSDSFITVEFRGGREMKGSLANVRLKEVTATGMLGELK